MSLSKLYSRIDFENNTTPALNETNLNLISKAIDDIDDRVIELGDDVLQYVPQILSIYSDIQTLSQNPPYIGANGNWYVWDTNTSAFVDSGQTAQGNGISSIAKTSTAGLVDTYTITYDDGQTSTFAVTNGADGNGISVIAKTSTSGLVDTYTITFTDSTTTTFTVTNGSSISSISKTSTAGLVDTYTVTMTDGSTSTFTVTNGADGNGIVSIALTSGTHAAGTLDTYTVTYTDGTTSTFQVYNGADGSGSGDMLQADYDSDGDVKTAGGIKSWVTALGYITGLAWSEVTDKPFSTVGSGLTVSSDTLSADIQSVSLTRYNTASSTTASYQKVTANGSSVGSIITGSMYMEQTKTLSTSSTTTYTFTNSNITTSSAIDVYTDIYGVNPSSVSVSSGTCTVVFPKYSSATSMACRIYIK